MRRGIAALAAIAIILPACSGAASVPSTTTPEPSPTPPPQGARRIDVGGYELEIRCEGAGPVTVVLENGASPFVDVFTDFKPLVAAEGWRVCSYDRAGTGASDPGPKPRDAAQIAGELDALLSNAGEQGPFVFGTLSAGSFYTLRYAYEHPELVRGIVFIDPRLPAYQLAMPTVFDDPEKAALIAKLPEPYRLEYETWSDDSRQLINDGSLADIPIVVLTAGDPEQAKNLGPPWDDYDFWVQTHQELAASVPRGEQRTVADAGHIIFQDNPQAVIDAFRTVIDAGAP